MTLLGYSGRPDDVAAFRDWAQKQGNIRRVIQPYDLYVLCHSMISKGPPIGTSQLNDDCRTLVSGLRNIGEAGDVESRLSPLALKAIQEAIERSEKSAEVNVASTTDGWKRIDTVVGYVVGVPIFLGIAGSIKATGHAFDAGYLFGSIIGAVIGGGLARGSICNYVAAPIYFKRQRLTMYEMYLWFQKDKYGRFRGMILNSLNSAKSGSAIAALIDIARDKTVGRQWQLEAIDALSHKLSGDSLKEAKSAILEAIHMVGPHEKSTVRRRAGEILRRISGVDHGSDVAAWEKGWGRAF